MQRETNVSQLVELNALSFCEDGVYRKDLVTEFGYSDGEKAEQDLFNILNEVEDLSSDSQELEARIIDWPTEYHLSSARANLLRGLNIADVSTVLELGCGCGAISRYLGEQDHLTVDSVEGSSVRASLAALRCKDLDNVSISHGNFNDMAFPEGHYDLVLFVGVTEYAGRFSDRQTDQEALQDLLSLACRALKPNGVALVAIENRLGLKYLMGASEDHYGIPYVGIENYPDSTGIRTYSRDEWESEIERSEFDCFSFSYPFPDYKIPNARLADKLNSSDKALDALEQCRSRDYLKPFDLGDKETKLWLALNDSGLLGQFANSFLILLGNDQQVIDKLESSGCDVFKSTKHQYLIEQDKQPVENDSERHNPKQQLHINNLGEQIQGLNQKIQELETQLNLIHGSKSWKVLQKLRSIFRRV